MAGNYTVRLTAILARCYPHRAAIGDSLGTPLESRRLAGRARTEHQDCGQLLEQLVQQWVDQARQVSY
jgi:hypothetical protein